MWGLPTTWQFMGGVAVGSSLFSYIYEGVGYFKKKIWFVLYNIRNFGVEGGLGIQAPPV